MTITELIENGVIAGVKALYGEDITTNQITMNVTRKEFEGDYTVVTFPFTRLAKKKPDEIAQELGEYMVANVADLSKFNVVKGFLNFSVSDSFWQKFLLETADNQSFGTQPANGKKIMVEYCSPNTNKPLHLGHIRNILLGWSTSKLYEAIGYDVMKVQVINDRGIAICKSMLAWEKYGEGATPESTGKKSDHFVGDYYVLFEQKFKEEYSVWQSTDEGEKIFDEKLEALKKKEDKANEGGKLKDIVLREKIFKAYKNTYFNNYSALGKEAREMLQKWEAGDDATMALWKKMNGWVYDGFEETFKKLGINFDKYYYESDTYLLGKDSVEEGLKKGVFYKKEDGSTWADLTDDKLDQKVVLRSDGTSVYITQDIGTAQQRYEDFGAEKMVYVVADEQNYHFQALFSILKKLGEPFAEGLYHLSYGMVDLPTGKMKSREGTVVDADDLMAEVISEAAAASAERGETAELSQKEKDDIIRKIALAALKYQIIKVHPKKRMVFDPKESVDLQGQTGPNIQYAYVRVSSVVRKAISMGLERSVWKAPANTYLELKPAEKNLIGMLYRFPDTVKSAALDYDPSHIASYCYDLSKGFHQFFAELSILKAESEEARAFRLELCQAIANTLKTGMDLLGIEMPERM